MLCTAAIAVCYAGSITVHRPVGRSRWRPREAPSGRACAFTHSFRGPKGRLASHCCALTANGQGRGSEQKQNVMSRSPNRPIALSPFVDGQVERQARGPGGVLRLPLSCMDPRVISMICMSDMMLETPTYIPRTVRAAAASVLIATGDAAARLALASGAVVEKRHCPLQL